MAFLNILGAETGDTSELHANASCTVQSSIKRTGAYAYQFNTTSSIPGWGRIRKLAATGAPTIFVETNAYFSGYFYVGSRPSAADEDVWRFTGAATNGPTIAHTTSGTLKLYYYNGSNTKTLVGTTSALSTSAWHLFEVSIVNYATGSANGSIELKIDGVSALSATSIQHTASSTDHLESCIIGSNIDGAFSASNVYWDDIAISDSAYPGAGQVNILVPTAAGTESTGWASGTGATYAEVDEIPHDSDTTYIKSTAAGDARNYNLTDSATAGVAGTVGAVKFCAINRNEGGAPSGHVRWGKTSISASTSTSTAAFPASYGLIAGISSTWTTTADVDALILGVAQVGTSLAARCTALYAMVWSTGQINTTVTPGAASLTLTAYTPSSVVGTKLTPGALSLTTTRYTPTVLTPVVGTPGTLSAALTAYAPAATVGLAVTPGTASLILTAYTPTVINPQSATPGTLALALTAYEPGAVVNSIVTPGALTTALTAYAPAALLNNIVTPGALSASLTAYAPSAIVNFIVTPGAGSLAIATYGINIYLPGSAFGARQYWRSTQHKEYTKLVPYRDYRRVTTYKDYIKSVKWVDRA